ncbi:MAG: DNA-binding transcriptional LysR family regulator [Pseudomonadales bacterium]|jgi:DNA-binding transcriptional LysR family regulator
MNLRAGPMDIAALKTLIEIANTGSFSAAANNLHITQPAISKRIAKLEQEMNTPLLDRIGKQVKPTEAGLTLLVHAKKIFADISQAERAVREISSEVTGTLHIATSHHIGLHRLPPILKRFSDSYPAVKIKIEFTDSEKAYAMVNSGEVELAVITLALEEQSHINSTTLWEDPLIFMAAHGHKLTDKKGLSLIDLSEHYCVLPGLDTYTGQIVKALFDKQKLLLDASMATNYLETIKMMVSVGMGWTVLPKSMFEDTLVELHVDNIGLSRELGFISHQQHNQSAAAKAFVAILQQSN